MKSGKAVFNLLEDDCVDGRCIFSQTLGTSRHSILISTKNNQVYYLRVAAPDTVTFSFDLECFVPHDNASCLVTTSAECGDSYVILDLQTPVGYTKLDTHVLGWPVPSTGITCKTPANLW
ncbi:MAG: hypothetical protein U0V54_05905 [Saprospiraceae bacterium]